MGTFDYPTAIYVGNSWSAGVYSFIFTDEDEDLVPRVAQQHRYGQRLREKFPMFNYYFFRIVVSLTKITIAKAEAMYEVRAIHMLTKR